MKIQERPELKAMPALLEVASVQCRCSDKMEVLCPSSNAAGPLKGVGTWGPITHHLHLLGFSSLSPAFHFSYLGPASSVCCRCG